MFLTMGAELAASYARMENTYDLLGWVCFGYAVFIIIRAIKRIIQKITKK